MSPRRALFGVLLLGLASRAQATLTLRNLSISPEYICPGQAVTLKFQEQYSTNGGNNTWGVFSTNNTTWDDPNDYTYMDSAHTSGSTAASSPGTPGGLQVALAGGASDGFWHDYTFITTIPAGITGTNITFLLRGHDGAPDWAFSTTYDSQVSITTELTCTKKAIYNKASLWEQESSARLVIQSSCGTPSNTPTRTPTPTVTVSSTATRTVTPSATQTATPSATPTRTVTPSYSSTPTPSGSATPTPTPSITPTRTPTVTVSGTPTQTPSPSQTLTRSATATATASVTQSFTPSPPFSSTNTPTQTPSYTASDTPTQTLTRTPTATASATPTGSPSFTASFTFSATVTPSPTPSATPSVTESVVYSPTSTPSFSSTFTATPTATQSITFSSTATASATPTASPSYTATPSYSSTATPSATRTQSYTFTVSPTRTVSPTITETLVPVPYQVSVTIYNAAGERVRLLFDGSAAVLPQDVNLDRTVIRSGLDTATLDMLGQLSSGGTRLTWQGQNDSGQTVSSGAYYIKIEFHDPFGATTSYVKSIQVLAAAPEQHLDLYNSAGELVLRGSLNGLSKTAVSFSFDKDQLAVAFDQAGNALDAINVTVQFSDGSIQSVPWSGTSMIGQPLSSGTYNAVLVSGTESGTQVLSKSVTLIRAPDADLSWTPLAGPNPAPADGSPLYGRQLQIRYPAGELIGPRVQLYNAAGELVAEAQDLALTGIVWLSYEQRASGIYLAVLEGKLLSGAPYRRIIKVAILH